MLNREINTIVSQP